MNRISINKVIPDVFSDLSDLESGIWNTDISFEREQAYLIEAVSGKGKSTLCSYIYGYRKDYEGAIFFNNKNIREIAFPIWDQIRTQELSLLFQELNLFSELTAFENIVLKNKLTNYKTERQINEMFEQVGIADKKNQLVAKMSWGQQQRVAIVRCLCQPFHFIVLDEPISHLDDDNANIVAQLIQDEAKQQGAGIISTSIGKPLPIAYSNTLAL